MMQELTMVHNSEEITFRMERLGNKVTIERDGKFYNVELRTKTFVASSAPKPRETPSPGAAAKVRETASAPSVVSAGTVASPLAGTIKEIKLPVGSPVNEASVVILMEAMKMEIEVCAQAGGSVTAVYVREGEQVQRNQNLFAVG